MSGLVNGLLSTCCVGRCSSHTPDPRESSQTFSGPRPPSELLASLDDEGFALVRHCVDRNDAKALAVRTHGRNMSGPLREYTFEDLRKSAYWAAAVLYDHGMRRGSTMLSLQWNSWESIVAYWGSQYIGSVVISMTPMNTERRYLIKYSACHCIVAPHSILEDLEKEIDTKTYVRLVLVTDVIGGVSKFKEQMVQKGDCIPGPRGSLDDCFDIVDSHSYALISFDGARRSESLATHLQQEYNSIRKWDNQSWYLTSGTTGKPKGCVHRQIDLAYAGETYGRSVMGCKEGCVTATDVLMAGPYAMGSNNIFPLLAGAAIYLDHTDKLDPSGITKDFQIIRMSRPDIFVSIPGTIDALAHSLFEGNDAEIIDAMRNLKVVTSAGAPLPPPSYCNFIHTARMRGLPTEVLDGIGTSELQHIFISNMVGDVLSKEGCIGTLVQGYEARLMNYTKMEDGSFKGELMVRTMSPSIQVTYSHARQPKGYDLIKATHEARYYAADGGAPFYITGDVATAKYQGGKWYFYLLGRTKDLTIYTGEARGMSVDDYKRKAVANDIMSTVGLMEHTAQICKELHPKSSDASAVLANEVFPVALTLNGCDSCIYVVSVTESFWPPSQPGSKELCSPWVKYIHAGVGGAPPVLFAPASHIPRTQPPLLKPKVCDMKANLQKWLDANVTEAKELSLETCMSMTLAGCL